jgi:hypothetical protein
MGTKQAKWAIFPIIKGLSVGKKVLPSFKRFGIFTVEWKSHLSALQRAWAAFFALKLSQFHPGFAKQKTGI